MSEEGKKKLRPQDIVVGLVIGVAFIYWLATKSNPSNQEAPAPEPAAVTEGSAPAQVQEKPIATLDEAIETSLPAMTDFKENELSPGAASLILWSADKMTWADLQKVPLGKYGMVMKDSDSQRGKRICVSGQVIEIATDKSLVKPVFIGGMFDDELHVYRFVAVGSSGEIVDRSRAKFCGIVTGKNDYANSAGGMAHAVHLVGMFDLPENNHMKNGATKTKHQKEREITLEDGTKGTLVEE